MSKWLGFATGLIVSIALVFAVLRPAGQSPVSDRDQALELPSLASAGVDSIEPEPPGDTAFTDEAMIPEPVAEPVPEPEAPVKTPAPVEPAPEAPAAVVDNDVEDIPEFRWDAAPESNGETAVAALPEPDVSVIDGPPLVSERAAPVPPPLQASGPAPAPETALEPAAPLPTQATPGRQWFAFWQPFGSEISAKGFSERLERVTGLDYRVVKVEAGEYHVAFGYDNEESRLSALSTIEEATGLRLGGKSL